MILSEERQSHWAHVVTDQIWHDDLVDYSDEDMALRMAKKALVAFVARYESMDQMVKEKIGKLKRGVVEGSPEWEILYSKYMAEELNKKSI